MHAVSSTKNLILVWMENFVEEKKTNQNAVHTNTRTNQLSTFLYIFFLHDCYICGFVVSVATTHRVLMNSSKLIVSYKYDIMLFIKQTHRDKKNTNQDDKIHNK